MTVFTWFTYTGILNKFSPLLQKTSCTLVVLQALAKILTCSVPDDHRQIIFKSVMPALLPILQKHSSSPNHWNEDIRVTELSSAAAFNLASYVLAIIEGRDAQLSLPRDCIHVPSLLDLALANLKIAPTY
jgi:hypothetical protein